nr:uncharacterized protein LOC112013629 [Quercus suber]
MEDKWIPNHPSNMILFPTKYDEWEWRVSDLIDWRVNQWDRDRIYNIFHHFDAEAILRIPLSRRQVARRLAEDAIGREESSKQRKHSRVWSQLWKLRVPNKIKIFGWRACLDILPSKVNLARRKILTDTTCGVCQRCPKTLSLAIWSCSAAQDVWAGASARIQKCGGEMDEFLHFFQFMMSKLSQEELENFLVHCWLIWHRCNTLLHGGVMQHPGHLNRRATDFLREYSDAQGSLTTGAVQSVVLQNWMPPMGQLYKLNFDAAVFSNGSGIGVVIRNATGDVLAALLARGAP